MSEKITRNLPTLHISECAGFDGFNFFKLVWFIRSNYNWTHIIFESPNIFGSGITIGIESNLVKYLVRVEQPI
ncbi:hypothetical protein VCHA30O60_100082 [Vibrio chagasii]|nr:hypothetical protein VCHA30O60_100082 [Vibrio chagasii]